MPRKPKKEMTRKELAAAKIRKAKRQVSYNEKRKAVHAAALAQSIKEGMKVQIDGVWFDIAQQYSIRKAMEKHFTNQSKPNKLDVAALKAWKAKQ